MERNGMGEQITEQRGESRGLWWIRPQMMHQLLSSIALFHENKAPNQLELLKLFPESRTPSEHDTIASSFPPSANDSRSVSGSSLEKQSTAELTILYNGEVKVYNVSADKAQAVMQLADSYCLKERATSKPSDGENEELRGIRAGLGMAKKLSLQRFLQKRKDRVKRVIPYTSTSKGRKWAEEDGDGYEQIRVSLSLA